MSEIYCQYCLPTKRKYHWNLHVDYYTERIRDFLMLPASDSNWLWSGILNFFRLLGGVEFVKNPDETQIYNRSLVVFQEAQKRGIDIEAIKIFGGYKNEFRFKHKGRYYYFEANPLADIWHNWVIDHKAKFKALMQKHGIPVPEGRMFANKRKAMAYAQELGFPVVIKPATGSLGYHSVYLIQDSESLEKAIDIAQKFRPDFILEKHIHGTNYRATVIGPQVFVFRKELPNVIGDGVSSIEKLIDAKNQHPFRADYGPKNTTLYRIPKNDMLKANLAKQNLNLNTTLDAGKKIYFFDDFLPGTGADIINATADTHPANRELFLKAARVLETELIGFDLICDDIQKPYSEQTFAMLEGNTLPYIDMHAYPSHGDPDPVAAAVWDTVMEKLH